MDMGQPSNERALLDALISAAAPDPLPAGQALPLLQQSGEKDAAVLGRLAYHALTGVDPGEDPSPPGEVAPGFPPFAAEVLMRAISGPDHRRPTAQALLIVLDTVPLASWPGADRPFVSLEEVAPSTVETPVADTVPDTVADTVLDSAETPVEPDPEPEVEVEVDEEVEELAPEPAVAVIHQDEFRTLLTPSRSVPRFDPLTDPWNPDTGEIARIDLTRIAGADVDPVVEPEAEAEPEPELEAVVEAVVEEAVEEVVEEVAEPEPEPEAVAEEAEDAGETDVPEPAPVPDDDDKQRGMHDEFRNFVSPSFAVPHFEPLEGQLPAGSDRVRRRRTRGSSRDAESEQPKKPEKPAKPGKPEKPEKVKAAKAPKERVERPQVANASSDDDRHQTLLLVGVILVLIVLGVVYAATRDNEDKGTGDPQGASRSIVQPSPVAV